MVVTNSNTVLLSRSYDPGFCLFSLSLFSPSTLSEMYLPQALLGPWPSDPAPRYIRCHICKMDQGPTDVPDVRVWAGSPQLSAGPSQVVTIF